MASVMRVWYDREGDFLEVTFRDAKGYLYEVVEGVYKRVDEAGNVLGYAFLNFSRHDRQALVLPLEARRPG